MPISPNRRETVRHLARQLQRLERKDRPQKRDKVSYPRGLAPLDAIWPPSGLAPGSLVEWLAQGEGSGAGTLLLMNIAQWIAREGNLVVIDGRRELYPAALTPLGLDLQRLVVLHPSRERDLLWALEQSLRCSGVAATVCWLEGVDHRTFRRLQLASEQGKGVGWLWRPARYRSQPSWADVRVQVQALPNTVTTRRWRVERLRGRGVAGPSSIELELNDETGALHLVPQLAPATVASRATGA